MNEELSWSRATLAILIILLVSFTTVFLLGVYLSAVWEVFSLGWDLLDF